MEFAIVVIKYTPQIICVHRQRFSKIGVENEHHSNQRRTIAKPNHHGSIRDHGVGVDYKVCLGVDTMKWIRVEDRLPEAKEGVADGVLVVGKNGYDQQNGIVAWYWLDGWKSINGRRVSNITHWMPLPEPPEDK